jgi:hypothetical protein
MLAAFCAGVALNVSSDLASVFFEQPLAIISGSRARIVMLNFGITVPAPFYVRH